MPVEVTARHMDSKADIQEYARGRGAQIMEAFPGVEHVHVILDIQKHRHIAEVVVQARNHVKLEAAEASDSMGASIDIAAEKVEKQLRRLHDKMQDHTQAMKHAATERVKGTET